MNKSGILKKFKFAIIITLSIIMIGSIFIPFMSTPTFASADDTNTSEDNQPSTIEVVSYLDIFENYYEIATEQLQENNLDMPFTLEQFCEGYYSHEYDIALYTDKVVDYAIEYTEKYLKAENSLSLMSSGSSSSSSGTADYILTSYTNYTVTPQSAFRRAPDYDGYDTQTFDYSTLQVGDIVHESETVFFDTGHTAIISDIAHDSYYGDYIQTIEAVAPNVSYGILDDNRMVNYGVMILRVVDASAAQRQSAVYFAERQIGKPYSLNTLRLNTSINSSQWYCSELVYAAYNYAGIDIGVRKDEYGFDYTMQLGCLPWDIYYSYNTYDKGVKGPNYIDIQLLYGPRWQVRIFNNTGGPKTVYYNSKMAFEGDAKNWTGLSDVKTTGNLASGDYETVTITENWFATDIAISVIVGGKRYVTYAHNLSSTYYTMSIFYN